MPRMLFQEFVNFCMVSEIIQTPCSNLEKSHTCTLIVSTQHK